MHKQAMNGWMSLLKLPTILTDRPYMSNNHYGKKKKEEINALKMEIFADKMKITHCITKYLLLLLPLLNRMVNDQKQKNQMNEWKIKLTTTTTRKKNINISTRSHTTHIFKGKTEITYNYRNNNKRQNEIVSD